MMLMVVSICFVALTLSSLSLISCAANFALRLQSSAYSRFIRSEEGMSKRLTFFGTISEFDNGNENTFVGCSEMKIWLETNCLLN